MTFHLHDIVCCPTVPDGVDAGEVLRIPFPPGT
jgi:hypothetical protein